MYIIFDIICIKRLKVEVLKSELKTTYVNAFHYCEVPSIYSIQYTEKLLP